MVVMTTFYAEKCCHMLNEHEASAMYYAEVYTSSWSIVRAYLLCLVCFRLRTQQSSLNLHNWSVVKRLVKTRHICTFV